MMKEMLQYLPRTPYDYPDEVLLTENGSYMNKCSRCDKTYHGPKRSFNCYPCKQEGEAAWAKLTPEEQHTRMVEFGKLAAEIFKKHRIERENNG